MGTLFSASTVELVIKMVVIPNITTPNTKQILLLSKDNASFY